MDMITDIIRTTLRCRRRFLPEYAEEQYDDIIKMTLDEISNHGGLPTTPRLAVCALDASLSNAIERTWPWLKSSS